ncbi:hypothetical protein JNO54_01555 [Janibacter sp. YIM B02568]|uniref:aldolase/citrate lyase family protein n=1 Tax=Janibacter endophyticus TaxID=2806261 RepID=UPI00194E95D3|nr:aldolase/citrate lyase family protein [Janibacter endophyticus]MBM6544828.1 hypothetical protein [Janibacter endophyticus]
MDSPSSPREVSKGAEPGIGPSSRGLWLMGSGVDLALVQCALMIETAGALEAVEEIAALDGVDLLFLGPVDLSLALGTTVAELLEAKGARSRASSPPPGGTARTWRSCPQHKPARPGQM